MEASGHSRIPSKECVMDFNQLDAKEQLIAEQAILGYREVVAAAQAAPHGRGLEFVERATLEQGRRQMARVLEQTLAAVSEGEKRGVIAAAAEGGRPTAIRPR
jgi:hypothetical protein